MSYLEKLGMTLPLKETKCHLNGRCFNFLHEYIHLASTEDLVPVNSCPAPNLHRCAFHLKTESQSLYFMILFSWSLMKLWSG